MLMVFPVIYMNVLEGIRSADEELLEMAQVFRLSVSKKLLYIYLPAVAPFFVSACSVSLGLCWKSGIAAEVICRTQGSLGDLLWGGKATISYDQVFALAAVIVLCSALLRFAALGLTRKEGGHDPV